MKREEEFAEDYINISWMKKKEMKKIEFAYFVYLSVRCLITVIKFTKIFLSNVFLKNVTLWGSS